MPKQPVPYYIESYPAYPTFYLTETLCLCRVEKFLIDPTDTLPRKVVLQYTFGENFIEEQEDYSTFTFGKTSNIISPYQILELFSQVHNGEDEIESLVKDLKWWGITQVSNVFSKSNETVDIDTFSQRVCDFCQKDEELDSRWYHSDKVLAQFFKRDNSTEDSSMEGNTPEDPTKTRKYERLGFPTKGFKGIPLDKQSKLVETLRAQLGSYMACELDEFKYLLLTDYQHVFDYQPRIKWDTGPRQFMRAVFSKLFPEEVINSKKKACCYCYSDKNGNEPKPISLNRNLEKITDKDKEKVEGIINNCYEAIGLERKTTALACE